jgi:hypothetical protein
MENELDHFTKLSQTLRLNLTPKELNDLDLPYSFELIFLSSS